MLIRPLEPKFKPVQITLEDEEDLHLMLTILKAVDCTDFTDAGCNFFDTLMTITNHQPRS